MSKIMKVMVWIIGIFAAITLVGGTLVAKRLNNSRNTNYDFMQTDELASVRQEKRALSDDTESLNILLMGLDGEETGLEIEYQEARADTIVLASINPKTNQTLLTHIPRDTRVYYPKTTNLAATSTYEGGYYDKINHAYVYGGPELVKRLVEELYQVPIDYYAVVNMKGMADLIDSIDGIEVKSPLDFEYRKTNFIKDETRHVNGVQAMNFMRMRKDDPRGDFGRQERQKIALSAIADKVFSMNPLKYTKLIPFAYNYLKTDFKFTNVKEVVQLMSQYKHALTSIEMMDVSKAFSAIMIEDVYYGIIDNTERLRIVNELREHQGLSRLSGDFLAPYYDKDEYYRNGRYEEVDVLAYPEDLGEGWKQVRILPYPEHLKHQEEERQTTYEEPVYEEPVYEEPVYEEPVWEEPVYEEFVYEEPEPEPEPEWTESVPELPELEPGDVLPNVE